MGLVMARVASRAGPADWAARLEPRANELAARFVRTARRDCLDHLKEKAFDHRVLAIPANPASTPKIGNRPSQYGWRLPMRFLMDARTVAHVHRFEAIQEDPRRPGTSLSAPSLRDCTYRSQPIARDRVGRWPNETPEQDATWLHSYVSDNKRRTSGVCEAPSPKETRKAATRSELPADRVARVQGLDSNSYMRGVNDA